MCLSDLNSELVFSILKGVTMFSQVTFKEEEVANAAFYRVTAREIVPEIRGNDAAVRFNKLVLKKKDWTERKASDTKD